MDRKLMIEIMENGEILDVSGTEIAADVGPNEVIMAYEGRLFIVNFKEVQK